MLTRRKLLSSGCALGAAAALGRVVVAQTSPTSESFGSAQDPLSYVNPEFRSKIKMMESVSPHQDLTAETLPQVRKMSTSWATPVLPAPAVVEKMIPGSAGSPQVQIYMVGASPEKSRPAILHIHGGGYVAGSAASEKRMMQDLSVQHDCVAVGVEYRLAPETRFPGSLEDNYAALRWMFTNAKELGIDPRRIAIKGESAGGGHAAALAIAVRDRGEVPICLQVLIYPMLDDRTGSTRRLPPYIGHYIWDEQANRFGWSSLLGVPAGSPQVPPNSVPARVENLAGLAPAFIGVGSIDLFGAESMEYAKRLTLAGVPTELNVVPGAFHGFDLIAAEAPLSIQFTHAWNEALRRAFTEV